MKVDRGLAFVVTRFFSQLSDLISFMNVCIAPFMAGIYEGETTA